jgi:hypothetical protein
LTFKVGTIGHEKPKFFMAKIVERELNRARMCGQVHTWLTLLQESKLQLGCPQQRMKKNSRKNKKMQSLNV